MRGTGRGKMAGIGQSTTGVNPAPRAAGLVRAGLVMAGIAASYMVAGWLGWMTALPPGYASLIWPGAGIALATVLLYSRSAWPAVFLGSFAINLWISASFHAALSPRLFFVPALLATGATLQALTVATLVRRRFGRPIKLMHRADILVLFLIIGPAGSCIAATVGTLSLMALGTVALEGAARNWAVWWAGDTMGVLLIFPLAIMAPWWREDPIQWQGRVLTRLNMASLAVVTVSMVLTFYIWTSVTSSSRARGQQLFDQMATELVVAFEARMRRYEQSLAAGEGLVLASAHLSRDDWRTFVDRIDIGTNLPGVSGLGLIVPVARDKLTDFVAHMADEGIPHMVPYPITTGKELFLVKFIEPLEKMASVVGLDISFEENRRNAALAARDSGKTVLSKPIRLAQSDLEQHGFLLLRPVYRAKTRPMYVTERRASFVGWVYAPLSVENIFVGLTPSMRREIDLTVRLASDSSENGILFSSTDSAERGDPPLFHREQAVSIYGRTLIFQLASSRSFEHQSATHEGALVLGAGLIITGLIATLLATLLNREAAAMRLFREKERALSAQERLNSSIVDTAVVGTASTDARGKILRMSRTGAAMFGMTPDEAEGQSIYTLFGIRLDDLGETEPGPAGNHRFEVMTRSLGRRVLDVQVSSWANEVNEQRQTWVIDDVTAQAEVEQRLHDTEQRLDMALVGARIGVFEIDLATGRSIVSRTWKDLMGLDADQDSDAQAIWRSRVDPEDLARVQASELACIRGETPRSVNVYRIRMSDGSLRWMKSDEIVGARDANGRALRLIGTQSDVTELVEAQEALQSSEALLRGVIANAPVGMALVDRSGVMRNVNEALCGFLGQRRDTLLGASLGKFTHPDDLYLDGDQLRRLLSGEISSYQCEKRYMRQDDTVGWGLLSVSYSGSQGDHDQALIAQIQDISELKAVERMKGDFIASVSHELRTPLTSIKGALGIVTGTMREALPGKAEHLLAIAQKNCDRLIQLVNDILDMEKLASDQTSFSFSTASLADSLNDVVTACQPFAQQFDVTLAIEPEAEVLMARIDVNRLNQVITNLVSNAVKYSPRGGVVKATVKRDGNAAVITVTDNGEGIPEAFRNRLFRPFSQIDMSSTRKVGGTGLGLSISRQIVDRMGGQIDFVSEPGVETTFSVTLPLAEGFDTQDTGTDAAPRRPRGRTKLPRILHVESDTDFAEVLRAAFGRRATMRVVSRLADARSILARDSFDLVIVDWELPDGPGEALLPDVSARPGLHIIGLSSREGISPEGEGPQSFVKSRIPVEEIVANCLKLIAAA